MGRGTIIIIIIIFIIATKEDQTKLCRVCLHILTAVLNTSSRGTPTVLLSCHVSSHDIAFQLLQYLGLCGPSQKMVFVCSPHENRNIMGNTSGILDAETFENAATYELRSVDMHCGLGLSKSVHIERRKAYPYRTRNLGHR